MAAAMCRRVLMPRRRRFSPAGGLWTTWLGGATSARSCGACCERAATPNAFRPSKAATTGLRPYRARRRGSARHRRGGHPDPRRSRRCVASARPRLVSWRSGCCGRVGRSAAVGVGRISGYLASVHRQREPHGRDHPRPACPACRRMAGHPGARAGDAHLSASCARSSTPRWRASTGSGIGRGDRVAIVLPNGPEMATAFLAVAAGATTAPLNPAYRADEFEFYLTDLERQGADRRGRRRDGPARGGRASGSASRCCELVAEPDAPAGGFTLDGDGAGRRRRRRRPGRAGRRRAGAAHLGHHVAAEDRAAAASATSPPRRATSARRSALTRGRPLPQHHAAVPHPRPDRGGAVVARGRRPRCSARPASTRCASSPGSTRRSRPGTRRCRPCTRRSWPAPRATPRRIARSRAALHPLVVGLAAAAGDGASWRRPSAAR